MQMCACAPEPLCAAASRSRFAVARDVKVDPLACFCAFLAPGAVARAELSMGKDARRCSPRTLSTLVEQRAALVLRAFTAPSDTFRTSYTPP